MPDEKAPSSFRDFRHLYDFQFEQLGKGIEDLKKSLESHRLEAKSDLDTIRKDIVGLKVKSAIWGATAAFLLSVISHFVPLGPLPANQLNEVQKQLIGNPSIEQSNH